MKQLDGVKLNCCIYCDSYYQEQHQCVQTINMKSSTKKEIISKEEDGQTTLILLQKMQKQIDELKENQTRLEKEVTVLKNIVRTKERNSVLTYLNNTFTTGITFFEWIQQIEIKESHLQSVFEGSLLSGMKLCIEENIQQLSSKIPIRVFKENPHAIFIFEQEEKLPTKKWQSCKKDYFENITYHLSLKFMDEYLKWEKSNERKGEGKRNTDNLIFKLYWSCNKTKQKQNEKEFATWFISRIQE